MKRTENNVMEKANIVIWKEHNNSLMYETWRFDHGEQKWVGYHSIPSWREEDIFLRYVLDDTDQLFNHLREMINWNIRIIYKGNVIAGNEWSRTMRKLNPEAFHVDYNGLTNRFINIVEEFLETNEDTYEENKLKWIEYPTPFVKKVLEERISFDEKGVEILEIEGIAHIIDSDLEESLLKRIINASFKDSGLLPRTFLEWRIYNAFSVKNREKFPFQLDDIRDESFREEIGIRVEEFSESLKNIVTSLMNLYKELIEDEEEFNESIYIEIYPIIDTKENMAAMTRFERKMEDIVEIDMNVSIWLDEVTKLMKEYPPIHYDYRMDPSPSIDITITAIAESKNPEFHREHSGFGLNNEYPDRILRYRHRGEGCDKWIPVD